MEVRGQTREGNYGMYNQRNKDNVISEEKECLYDWSFDVDGTIDGRV